MAREMRAGVVVATLLTIVSACSGPTVTPSLAPTMATPVPATPAATPQLSPTTAPATPSPDVVTPAPETTPPRTATSAPLPSPTILIPPPIDEPTTPSPRPTPTPTAPPTPVPTTRPPATDAPVLEGACLTFTNQPTGEFERSLLIDLSFEDAALDGIEIGISNTNAGNAAAASAVLPGLWQAQLGVNGQRLAQGSKLVIATVDDARGTHDLLPQLAEAIGSIPSNFRPGQSIGNSCGGF